MENIERELDAIEARAQAATEGPWANTDDWSVVQSYDLAIQTGEHSYERVGIIPGEYVRDNDAEFIAHARTDVPALIATIREQRAALDRVEDFIGYLDACAADDEPMLAKGKVSAKAAAEQLRAAITGEGA